MIYKLSIIELLQAYNVATPFLSLSFPHCSISPPISLDRTLSRHITLTSESFLQQNLKVWQMELLKNKSIKVHVWWLTSI